MMLFMFTLELLRSQHPTLFKGEATARIAEWFAAGAPEDIRDVPERIIARAMKETNETQRPN